MNRTFDNVYEDEERARAYATLQFPGTYYLAFRDLPALVRHYITAVGRLTSASEPVDRRDSSEISGWR